MHPCYSIQYSKEKGNSSKAFFCLFTAVMRGQGRVSSNFAKAILNPHSLRVFPTQFSSNARQIVENSQHTLKLLH